MKKFAKLLSALLLVLCSVFVVACAPKSYDNAVQKLVEKEYTVEVYKNDSMWVADDAIDDLNLKGDFYEVYGDAGDDEIVIIYFDKRSDAKKTYEELGDYFDLVREEVKVCEREGKMIIIAITNKAYNDFND